MSLHYVLDGYNIIKKSSFDSESLKGSRDFLLALIRQSKLLKSKNNKVTVVFDGKSDVFDYTYPAGELKVIYSKGENADELIKRIVQASPSPKNIVVVSEDRQILFFVRGCGAKIMDTKEFIRKIEPVDNAPKDHNPKLEITAKQASDITKELQRLWLNPNSSFEP